MLDPPGTLSTMDPDGTGASTLTGSPEAQASQPVWSPDGQRVAWALQSAGGFAVITAAPDGYERTSAPIEAGAFYLYWDPTSSRVAYLGSSGSTIEMGVVEGSHAKALGKGDPFYFSWAPDGVRLIAHVGQNRLDEITLSGRHTRIATAGPFDAPIWSGSTRIFAIEDGVCPEDCLVSAMGNRMQPIVATPDPVLFAKDPASPALAVVQAPGNTYGPLRVAEPAGRDWAFTTVTEEEALAFFWSPAGHKLLYATFEETPTGPWMRWNVWDGETSLAFDRFRPSPIYLRDYMPFFEQYGQSQTLWSPDGRAFAYPGIVEGRGAGIWVQEVREDATPVRIADGEVVAWSPV